uniref:Transmembrane channel-like protein n=1 Tax=Eptatretus burgeri TaxID=7764 RepID=A0A8C4QGR3_EPTBU
MPLTMREKMDIRSVLGSIFIGRTIPDANHILLTNSICMSLIILPSFVVVAGKFGMGTRLYFSFLRFLVVLNVTIFLVLFVFISLPLILSHTLHFQMFLQGFLEPTYLFYGYYETGTVRLTKHFLYNIPIAYLLGTTGCLFLSLILIVVSNIDTLFPQTDLEEDKRKKRIERRSRREWVQIYFIRALINVLVLLLLAGSFYCVYITTKFQSEMQNVRSLNFVLNLIIEYLPSVVITVANFFIPLIFAVIIVYEKYTPAFELKLNLTRSVFLRLASIAVLVISLWLRITRCDSPGCRPCGYNHVSYPCWERRVGQEMYKLTIFDFIIVLCMALFIFVQLIGLRGRQQFDIAQNVLDLVYSQTICWVGTFFCPVLPLITTVKFFFVFYMKWVISQSSNKSFGMICSCSSFPTMWAVVPATIQTMPYGVQRTLRFMLSETFAIPLVIMLCLVMFYIVALAKAHKRVVEQLQEQLATVSLRPTSITSCMPHPRRHLLHCHVLTSSTNFCPLWHLPVWKKKKKIHNFYKVSPKTLHFQVRPGIKNLLLLKEIQCPLQTRLAG